MMPEGDFPALLLAAQQGDEWAFAALYDAFNPRLVRYFAARVPAEADDLAADTWLDLAKRIGSFRGDETNFRSFLFTIAHRRMVDHWRRRRADLSSAHHPVDGARVAARDGGVDRLDDPETFIVGELSARAAVRRIAAVLSRDQAEVVLLRVLAGLEVDEVAAILDKRPATVRVLQHRALKRLAREFSLEGVTL